MLRLAANISTLFTEWPLLERPAAAAASGFAAIEMQFPYGVAAEDLAAAREAAQVEFVLINMPPGRLDEGELGLACVPGREAEFAEGVDRAIACADALQCRRINCLAGNIPQGERPVECRETLITNLRLAAERLAGAGILLLTEVLNPADFPAFALTSGADGLLLLDEVGHPNLALQYDVYHRRAAGEDWLQGLVAQIDRIGHIQFSDYPGRHEPGSGHIDFERLFETIAALPYEGWTGCEYWPTGSTLDSLGWRRLLDAGEIPRA